MSDYSFLKLLNDNKQDIKSLKKILSENKDLINKAFKINNPKNNEIITYSPLAYSIEKKLSELSIFLIDQGADINFKILPFEDYPILIACRYGLADVVKKLLSCENVNINSLNKKNETCFSISQKNSDAAIYPLLIQYNSKKNKIKKISPNSEKNNKNNSDNENNINNTENLSDNSDIENDGDNTQNNNKNSKTKINNNNYGKNEEEDIPKISKNVKRCNRIEHYKNKIKIISNYLTIDFPLSYNHKKYLGGKIGKLI